MSTLRAHFPDFTRSMLRALVNSHDTTALLDGEELSSVDRMNALVGMMAAHPEGRRILAERPRVSSETVDFAALARLPQGTLGREFVEHLRRNQLDQDTLCAPVTRGPSDTANYLLERVRQTHDVWHTVHGLGAAPYEEVLAHAFQWSQLRMPYSALVVVFGTFKHFVGEARWQVLRRTFPAAVQAGRDAHPLLPVYWEDHWDEPLDRLRARLNVRPASAW